MKVYDSIALSALISDTRDDCNKDKRNTPGRRLSVQEEKMVSYYSLLIGYRESIQVDCIC